MFYMGSLMIALAVEESGSNFAFFLKSSFSKKTAKENKASIV